MPVRKILFAILIVLLTVAPALAATETFYICNGGNGTLPETDACATAWDADDFNDSANWDTDDQDDGKIGPNDDVLFKDDGGYFRSYFQTQKSGLSGKPITLKNYPGDSPEIRTSEAYANTDWTLWYNSGGKKIWRIFVSGAEFSAYAAWSADAGSTWTKVKYKSYWTFWTQAQIQANLGDHFFYSDASNDGEGWEGWETYGTGDSYAYYRDDSASVNTDLPALWEIGTRRYAMMIGKQSGPVHTHYITIDGLTIFAISGRQTGWMTGRTDGEGNGIIVNAGINYLTVKNSKFYYGGLWGINMWGGEHLDTLIENNQFDHLNGGFHIFGTATDCVKDSQTCDGLTVRGNRFTNIGTIEGDGGDREAIGIGQCKDILIEQNYIKNNNMETNPLSNNTPNLIALFGCSQDTVQHNYVEGATAKSIGTSAVFPGSAWADCVGGNDTTVHANVFDGYEQGHSCDDLGISTTHPFSAATFTGDWDNCRTTCGTGWDGDGYIRFTNNLIINPKDWSATCDGVNVWASGVLRFGNNKFNEITVKNNTIIGAPSNTTPLITWHQNWRSTAPTVENNFLWVTTGRGVCADGGNPCGTGAGDLYMYDEIDGSSPGFYEYDYAATHNITNIWNADPELASYTEGAEYSKAPADGDSPLVLAGVDLGSGYEVIDPDNTDFTAALPSVTVVDQDESGGLTTVLNTPADGASGISVNPTLTINTPSVTGSSHGSNIGPYASSEAHSDTRWQVIEDSDDDSDCLDESGRWVSPYLIFDVTAGSAEESRATWATMLNSSDYYCWRVQTENGYGWGSWTAAFDFQTTGVPAAPHTGVRIGAP